MTATAIASVSEGAEVRHGTVRRAGAFAIRNWGLLLALAVLLFVLLMAVFPGLVATHSPLEADTSASLAPPSSAHWLGTDKLGRDVYSRIVYGTRTSLLAALTATALGFVLGGLLGTAAASVGGWVDILIMRVFDALLSLPGLLMVFAFLAAFASSPTTIALAIGLAGSVSFGRLMRAEVLRIRSLTYIEAARASGTHGWMIAFRHIVPNAVRPLISLAALDIGASLLAIGSMGYLGLGTQPPAPEWGAMIADGQIYIQQAPWLTIVPGVTFIIVVLATNRVSRQISRPKGAR